MVSVVNSSVAAVGEVVKYRASQFLSPRPSMGLALILKFYVLFISVCLALDPTYFTGMRVQGNQIVNSKGQVVRMRVFFFFFLRKIIFKRSKI